MDFTILYEIFTPKLYQRQNIPFLIGKIPIKENPLWNNFTNIEKYYTENLFDYKLIKHNNLTFYYEYINNELINCLKIEQDSLHVFVLEYCNKEVNSLKNLYNQCYNINKKIKIHEPIEALNELAHESIIYHTTDYSEIVSIIELIIKKL